MPSPCLGCLREFPQSAAPEGQESWHEYCSLCQLRISKWRRDEAGERLAQARSFLEEEAHKRQAHRAEMAKRLPQWEGEAAEMYRQSLMVRPEREGDRWVPRKRGQWKRGGKWARRA